MKVIAVDFETFYTGAYSVKRMGYAAYCRDARFDAYLVAFWGEEIQWVGSPADAPWEKIQGSAWISHNAAFDQEVFVRLQDLGTVPKFVKPPTWHCTADLAAHFGGPRNLEESAKQLLDWTVEKGLRAEMRDKKFTDLDPADKHRVCEYALHDAGACWKLWSTFGPFWPEHERELSQWTRKMGRQGIGFDQAKAAECRAILLALIATIEKPYAEGGPLPWRPNGKVASIKELKAACQAIKVPPPVSTAEKSEAFALWLEEYGERAPWIGAIRQWRRANRLMKVIEAMEQRTCDGRLQFSFLYFGTSTGRWSGTNGLNLQNLNKEAFQGVDLRRLLIPAAGQAFVIADLAQIEPRCLHWLAGDGAMLDLVRRGFPIYEAHARATMSWRGGRLKDENKSLYALAKCRVLGLGYGAGADKFRVIAKAMANLKLSDQECRQVVEDYRASNPKLVALWRRLEKAMRRTPQGETFKLPLASPSCPEYSARSLRYFNVLQPPLDETRTALIAATKLGDDGESWWGAKLAENLVQAMAREVFASRLLILLRRGYRVVLHVHDEVVVEVPEGDATAHQQEILSVLRQPPPWAPDLPLDAESSITHFYTK